MFGSKKPKSSYAAFDQHSKTGKYTETFFHYPTRNKHIESDYQKSHGQQNMNTFRLKGKTSFQEHLYSSSLNPFAKGQVRVEKIQNQTGKRKKMVEEKSFKKTDPLLMKYEKEPTSSRFVAPFESTKTTKIEAEKRFYLPSERKLSQNKKMYHSQVGLSFSSVQRTIPREAVNNSNLMRSTIQYGNHPHNLSMNNLDDFKYNSKK